MCSNECVEPTESRTRGAARAGVLQVSTDNPAASEVCRQVAGTTYQVYVHLGVAQSTPTTIAGYHPMVHLTHRLLCY
jgi:hypothetical protein